MVEGRNDEYSPKLSFNSNSSSLALDAILHAYMRVVSLIQYYWLLLGGEVVVTKLEATRRGTTTGWGCER